MFQRISLQSYPSHFQQASRSLMHEQYSKAEYQYKKCLQLNPSSYSSYLNLAYIFHWKQNYHQATILCDIAINMKPYCSEAYYNRCLALMAQGPSSYAEASIDLYAAFSCYFLQLFKTHGNIENLRKSIEYCENNIQAIRLMLIFTSTNKQFYKALLQKYQDSYRIQGQITTVRASASAEQGIFRLKSTKQIANFQELQKKLAQFIELQQLPAQPQQELIKQKMQIVSGLYSITVQADQLSLRSESQINQLFNSSSYEKVELQRHTTKQLPLQDLSANRLNIPEFNTRYSLADSFHIKSPLRSSGICDGMNNSRFSHHNGCLKCNRDSANCSTIPPDGVKMLIKTIEIFRNQNIYHPRPYLIIYGGPKQQVTEVDYDGGHFPKWSQTFYLSKQANPYRIELWHKDHKEKQDQLIGTATFSSRQGRFKYYFIKRQGGAKKTGYIFIQLGK